MGQFLPRGEENNSRGQSIVHGQQTCPRKHVASCTYVEDAQVPPPQRFPAVMAALEQEYSARPPCTKISRNTYLIAAVSSVTPSPLAPKSCRRPCQAWRQNIVPMTYFDIPEHLVGRGIRVVGGGALVLDVLHPERVCRGGRASAQRCRT